MKSINITYISKLSVEEIHQRLDNKVLYLVGFGGEVNQDTSFKRRYVGEFSEKDFWIRKNLMYSYSKLKRCTIHGEYLETENGTSKVKIKIVPALNVKLAKLFAIIGVPIALVFLFLEIIKGSSLKIMLFMSFWIIGVIVNYYVFRFISKAEMVTLERDIYEIIPKNDV